MSSNPIFKITYWGVTGTFCSPLRPEKVTEKVIEVIRRLAEKGRLAELRPGDGLRDSIARMLEEELPFSLRSTFGGNTTCVEVQTPDLLFILDCGSGFRDLGIMLEERWNNEGESAQRNAHVLLTHAHIDHTFATPYFRPYYDNQNSFTIWGPQIALDSLTAVLDPKSAMSQVYFPPTYKEMKALQDFRPITAGQSLVLGSTTITTFALNHPGGSMAYRFDNSGRSFVFATDHEQIETPDTSLADFARNADLLYTEGQYTAAEYAGEASVAGDPPSTRKGWGHSTIESCVITAMEAGVRMLHVGHRDPRRNDRQIAEMEIYLQKLLAEESRSRGKSTLQEALIPYEGLQVLI
jgi:phosphoribosyl 1,2-cyclic phosphodiesterase